MARAKEVPISPVPTIAIMVNGSSKYGLAGSILCEEPACVGLYLTPLDACQTHWNAGPRGAELGYLREASASSAMSVRTILA